MEKPRNVSMLCSSSMVQPRALGSRYSWQLHMEAAACLQTWAGNMLHTTAYETKETQHRNYYGDVTREPSSPRT